MSIACWQLNARSYRVSARRRERVAAKPLPAVADSRPVPAVVGVRFGSNRVFVPVQILPQSGRTRRWSIFATAQCSPPCWAAYDIRTMGSTVLREYLSEPRSGLRVRMTYGAWPSSEQTHRMSNAAQQSVRGYGNPPVVVISYQPFWAGFRPSTPAFAGWRPACHRGSSPMLTPCRSAAVWCRYSPHRQRCSVAVP
jgi:hypothetical protein